MIGLVRNATRAIMENSRHLDKKAHRSGLSMSNFTPNKRKTSRQCTSLGRDDEKEKKRTSWSADQQLRQREWGLGNKSDTRGCDKTASAVSERRAFWITNEAAGCLGLIKHLRSHSPSSELWLVLASLLIQPRSLWPLPSHRRRAQHSGFPRGSFWKRRRNQSRSSKQWRRFTFQPLTSAKHGLDLQVHWVRHNVRRAQWLKGNTNAKHIHKGQQEGLLMHRLRSHREGLIKPWQRVQSFSVPLPDTVHYLWATKQKLRQLICVSRKAAGVQLNHMMSL